MSSLSPILKCFSVTFTNHTRNFIPQKHLIKFAPKAFLSYSAAHKQTQPLGVKHSIASSNSGYKSLSRIRSLSPSEQKGIERRNITIQVEEHISKFNMVWPKITLFGDSITRRSTDVDNGCWGSMIEYRAGHYFDLDTRGFEGYNTRWAMELLPKLFPKSYLKEVEIFIPFFGHNDSWDAEPLHVPVVDYENNTRKIIKYLVENGLEKKRIIMITPAWYHHDNFAKYIKEKGFPPMGKTFEAAQKYSEAVLRVAQDESIDVLDLFSITAKHEPLDELFCDGVHFSRLGAKVLFEKLMPIIDKKIEASHGKPLADLWHAVHVHQHPEVLPVLEAHMKSIMKNQ